MCEVNHARWLYFCAVSAPMRYKWGTNDLSGVGLGVAGSSMSDNASIITLRLPQSLLDRADALLERLAREEEAVLLGRVSRSIVLRLAVLRGLESLEAEHGMPKAPSPPKKAPSRSSRSRR